MILRSFSLSFLLAFLQSQVVKAAESVDYLGSLSLSLEDNLALTESSENDDSFFGVLHTQEALDYWASKEDEILEVLEKRLKLIDEEIGLIEEYLEDYDESTGEAMRHLKEPKETPEERGKVVGSSAVLGHRMTSRYAGVIADLRRFLVSEDFLQNEEALARILEETQEFIKDPVTNATKRLAPGSEDLFLSMDSYLNVQKIYGYRPYQLVYGLNPANRTGYRMNAIQCAELGMFAIFRKEYQIAVEWLELADRLLVSGEDEEQWNVQLNIVVQFIQLAIQQHNRVFHQETKGDDSFLSFYLRPITPFGSRLRRNGVFLRHGGGYGTEVSPLAQFMQLCRGQTLQPSEVAKRLKCYFEQGRHPFLYINPVKVEQLSENPPVFQFYEVLGNKAIQNLRKRVGNKVKPFRGMGKEEGEVAPHWNTGAYHNLRPDDMPPQVLHLTEAITGMRSESRDKDFDRYVEYMEGRYFIQHPDSLQLASRSEHGISPHDEWASTFLYILEVPEAGGLTSFCQAGISANSVKGSALFWLNTYRNGTLRPDIHHGGCPVLQGHKIIVNQWLRYLDNWDNFKCSTNQWE